jgi:hypothetical protein
MLGAIEGLLKAMFDTVVMVSSFESLLEATQRINPDLIVAQDEEPGVGGQ